MIAATVALILGAASILTLGAAWTLIGGRPQPDIPVVRWDYSSGRV